MPRDPDILVDLTSARTEFEAETIAEALRAQGIPAQTFATAGSVLQWDVAVSQPIRVAVRRRDLDNARAILRAIRAESVDLDWSEVDTGDRTPITDKERAERQAPVPDREGSTGQTRGHLGAMGFWLGLILVVLAALATVQLLR